MNEAPENLGGGSLGRAWYLGIALLFLAFLMWALCPAVLLPPPTVGQEGWATAAALLVVREVALWFSAVVPGREVVLRYRVRLDPRRLSRREGP